MEAMVDIPLDQLLRRRTVGDGNLLPPITEALRVGGSIGDVCNAMRHVFGEYRGGSSSSSARLGIAPAP